MFSIGDLQDMTAQTRRNLQFWVESGVLKPSPETSYAGRGVHREFDAKEAIIALFLAGASSAKTWPIGWLSRMAEAIRNLIERDEKFRNHVNQSIGGKVRLFMIFDWSDTIDFLIDPSSDEWFKHTAAELVDRDSRDNCVQIIALMNPWLERARAPIP